MDVSRQSRGIKFSIGNTTQEKGSTPAGEKRENNLRLISNSSLLRSYARALENDKKIYTAATEVAYKVGL